MPRGNSSRDRTRLLDLLKQIRLDASLTQAQLAKRLSRPQSFVSKYESGERRLDILELRQVCRASGISTVSFLGRLEDADK